MSGRCGTCKHWQRHTEEYAVKYRRGANFGECVSAKFMYSGAGVSLEPQLDTLIYWDYEAYKAGFYVGQEFGCIHWAGAQPNEQLNSAELLD